MNPTNKVPSGTRVQTRVSFKEWARSNFDYSAPLSFEITKLLEQGSESAWNAALDSVILPAPLSESSGKRFEVGEFVEVKEKDIWKCATISAMIVERVDASAGLFWINPESVRPLPQTVELAVEEKRIRLMNAICDRKKTSQVNALGIIIDALYASDDTGKTLYQLCTEYGVPTTREVP